MAAEATGRQAALVELDPAYCDVIVRRWQEGTGQRGTRQDGSGLADASPFLTGAGADGPPCTQARSDHPPSGRGHGGLWCARGRYRQGHRHRSEDAAQALSRRTRYRQHPASTRIAESLYRKALGDGAQSVTAAIFWLKTRAHWKETNVHEVSGPVKIELSWQDARVL